VHEGLSRQFSLVESLALDSESTIIVNERVSAESPSARSLLESEQEPALLYAKTRMRFGLIPNASLNFSIT